MKHLLILLSLLAIQFAHAQENPAKKPKDVVILDGALSSREEVEEYAKQGRVKSINKGVTQEERDKLAEKFGDVIGEKEFIILISVYSEEEMREKIDRGVVPGSQNIPVNDQVKISGTNEKAQDFTVTMLDGRKITLSDLKGKVVLLNFWATWCGPCLKEFYEIPSKILEPFEGKEFVFLPISKGERSEKVAKRMAKLKGDGLAFNTGTDPEEEISQAYGAGPIPRNILIDGNGIIRYISEGYGEGSVDRLAAEIEKLLATAE